jgi:hypothetical protein
MRSISDEDEAALLDPDKLMFEIEKTLSACIESGKKRQVAINIYILLATMLAVTTFSDTPEATVPIVQLKLNKWLAVELLAILTCVFLFRASTMNRYRAIVKCGVWRLDQAAT